MKNNFIISNELMEDAINKMLITIRETKFLKKNMTQLRIFWQNWVGLFISIRQKIRFCTLQEIVVMRVLNIMKRVLRNF